MIINRENLNIAFTGFKAAFQRGVSLGPGPLYTEIATVIPSSTSEEKYAWLGQMPRMREWLGDRVVQNIAQHDYAIKNKSYETTVGVDRDHIEDDQYGIYAPLMEEMGRSVRMFPDELVFGLIVNGFSTACYDGQNFFDTDHPVLDAAGNEQSVANVQAGTGAPWFLLDLSRALKPIIYQRRKEFEFVSKDDPRTSDDVFNRKEYVYGTDGRCNVGFGFWQFSFGSKQPFSKDNLRAARTAMMSLKGDYGRPLGIVPNVLLVGPSNGNAARDVLLAERDTNGATNTDRNLVRIIETPWLQ
jgi:phage major head subunit gpT-like protein